MSGNPDIVIGYQSSYFAGVLLYLHRDDGKEGTPVHCETSN